VLQYKDVSGLWWKRAAASKFDDEMTLNQVNLCEVQLTVMLEASFSPLATKFPRLHTDISLVKLRRCPQPDLSTNTRSSTLAVDRDRDRDANGKFVDKFCFA